MSRPHPASRIPRYDQLGPDPEPLGVRAEVLLNQAVQATPSVASARLPRSRAPSPRRRSSSLACDAR